MNFDFWLSFHSAVLTHIPLETFGSNAVCINETSVGMLCYVLDWVMHFKKVEQSGLAINL